ncbi:MAG: hypothetical protein ACTSP3_10885 [Candidatus Heimdallarchaeaceae archaeon]
MVKENIKSILKLKTINILPIVFLDYVFNALDNTLTEEKLDDFFQFLENPYYFYLDKHHNIIEKNLFRHKINYEFVSQNVMKVTEERVLLNPYPKNKKVKDIIVLGESMDLFPNLKIYINNFEVPLLNIRYFQDDSRREEFKDVIKKHHKIYLSNLLKNLCQTAVDKVIDLFVFEITIMQFEEQDEESFQELRHEIISELNLKEKKLENGDHSEMFKKHFKNKFKKELFELVESVYKELFEDIVDKTQPHDYKNKILSNPILGGPFREIWEQYIQPNIDFFFCQNKMLVCIDTKIETRFLSIKMTYYTFRRKYSGSQKGLIKRIHFTKNFLGTTIKDLKLNLTLTSNSYAPSSYVQISTNGRYQVSMWRKIKNKKHFKLLEKIYGNQKYNYVALVEKQTEASEFNEFARIRIYNKNENNKDQIKAKLNDLKHWTTLFGLRNNTIYIPITLKLPKWRSILAHLLNCIGFSSYFLIFGFVSLFFKHYFENFNFHTLNSFLILLLGLIIGGRVLIIKEEEELEKFIEYSYTFHILWAFAALILFLSYPIWNIFLV